MDPIDLAETAKTVAEAPVVDVDHAEIVADAIADTPVEALAPVSSYEDSLAVLGYGWRCVINLVLPFVNGMMLGFGEIFAHEIMFRYGWFGARVQPPMRRQRTALAQSVLI